MKSEILETILDDFKSELINRLDGTDRHSEVRISFLRKTIEEIQQELSKNRLNERIRQ